MGGGNGEFFSLQNAKSRDWSVVGSSNLFLAHTMDPSGPFGVRAPPKSMCTHEAHALEKMEQNVHFSTKMETDVPGVRKSCGARLHPLNVSSKVWSRKGWYIHLPSTSRTEVTTQNVKAKIAIWVPTIF